MAPHVKAENMRPSEISELQSWDKIRCIMNIAGLDEAPPLVFHHGRLPVLGELACNGTISADADARAVKELRNSGWWRSSRPPWC